MAEFCAHRRASLYFARNEERGLRCVYHGWQYQPDGRCVDTPNERPENAFPDKVALPAYPCAERGGVVWTHMGPADPRPGLPDLEWALVPEDQRFVSKFWQDCNYLQALEGGIDPAHISFLHGILDSREDRNRNGVVDEGETDPRLADSDRGGLNDWDERALHGTNPTSASDDDVDGDGVPNTIDECDDTPTGAHVGPEGCPSVEENSPLPGVRFVEGRSRLLDGAGQFLADDGAHTAGHEGEVGDTEDDGPTTDVTLADDGGVEHVGLGLFRDEPFGVRKAVHEAERVARPDVGEPLLETVLVE